MHTLYIFPPVNYDSIGCYQDGKPRAFSALVINLRGKLNWSNMNETIYKCAQHVRHAGFTWFALHFYGECWSGKDAGKTYNLHGRSVECWEGVGKEKANFVYRLKAWNLVRALSFLFSFRCFIFLWIRKTVQFVSQGEQQQKGSQTTTGPFPTTPARIRKSDAICLTLLHQLLKWENWRWKPDTRVRSAMLWRQSENPPCCDVRVKIRRVVTSKRSPPCCDVRGVFSLFPRKCARPGSQIFLFSFARALTKVTKSSRCF